MIRLTKINPYSPICDFCGNEITSETYYVIGGQIACHDCCDERFVDTYVTEQMETEGMDEFDDDLPFC